MKMRILFLLCASLVAVQSSSAQLLKIVHFDVGQGDATLIWSPSGQTLLVDAGPSLEPDVVQPYLQAQGIGDLTYTLATHYHSDHIGEFPDLFTSGYLPGIAYDRGDNPGYSSTYYQNYVAAAGAVRQTISAGQVIDLGAGATAKAVCVNGHLMNGAVYNLDDENERSICLLVEYRNFRYTVSGDLGGGALSLFDLETPCSNLIGDINVFRVNHHGSNSSTNLNWLNNLDAEAAVVSLGDNNPYGFVHTEVIGRITANPTIQVLYHTEEGFNLSSKSVVVNGHVILQTDGLTSYTIAGDIYDLGPDVFVQVYVDPGTVEPIPASGGWLYWDIFAQNMESTGVPMHLKFWLEVPDYGPYMLIDIPNYILPPLPSGTTRFRRTYIPAGAPAGMYQLIGEFRQPVTETLYATDRDTFYKAESDVKFAAGTDWWLEAGNNDALDFGGKTLATAEGAQIGLKAYPSPFNPQTQISFTLPLEQNIRVDICDLTGRRVENLFDGHLEGGLHTLAWNAENHAAGVYFVRLTGQNLPVQVAKLMLVK